MIDAHKAGEGHKRVAKFSEFQRLNFAEEHEVKIELFGQSGQRYVWRTKGTEFLEKNISPTVKHGGGSIMLWGCIAASGTGNISQVEGRMDSSKFQQILKANVTPSVKKRMASTNRS